MRRTLALSGVGVLLLGWLHVPWMPCPLLSTVHVPCPGCGLTRACLLLIHGQVEAALRMHAMAPLFLALIAGLVIVALLPSNSRKPLLREMELFERSTRLVPLLLLVLLLYWIARFFVHSAFDPVVGQANSLFSRE